MMNEAKSVAILGTRGYPSFYGGFETAVRHLAPYLADHGWSVTVYGRPGSRGASDDEADPRIEVVSTRGIESKSLSTISYGFTGSFDLARRRRHDVVLVMNVANGYFLPFLRARGIPTLVNVDGMEWEREKWGRVAKKVFLGGAALTARWADEIVVDSEVIGERWLSRWGRNGTFIPYGGSPANASSSPPLGLTAGGYVLIVARLVPENSIPEILATVPRLPVHVPVVLVGSSGYGGELEDRARSLDSEYSNFHWLGHVKDDGLLHSLWQNAGVYVHGHSVGGTNPALVQAMALGAPTTARDTPFNREVMGAGASYWSDAASLEESVLQIVESQALQKRLRALAIERAQRQYTWELVCGAYDRALTGLVDRSRR
ncbi:glycosyltransferase [Cnuibacter sp. UC19_7]|uniref:glycosyltransferase n=1 Tax=Cnuibacter sp. UC19_7 TaxID=3350166 RepID=UPI003670AEF8